MNLLRLDVECPACGHRPAVRIPEAERDLALQQPATALKATMQCTRPRCSRIYPIFASAYQAAA